MQIKKIVSGAQTGADRAALDFALEYGIEHGGWVPEGRMAEDGPVPPRYLVRELPGGGYVQRTEKNVEDSDGTLIISRGDLTGGSLLTLQMAEKHAKPCLHVNLGHVVVFDAAIDVYEWLAAHRIEILNVAGPRASKDPGIYDVTRNILETAYHIDTISGAMPDSAGQTPENQFTSADSQVLPQSVEQAVKILTAELGAKTKSRIAGRNGEQIADLEKVLANYIIERFGLETQNDKLMESCSRFMQKDSIDSNEAASIIIGRLWEKLREIGHLRIVK